MDEQLGQRLMDRYNAFDPVRRMTGADIVLALAILKAVVEACDLLNPGWRSIFPWHNPIKSIQQRADRAKNPESVNFFQRGAARRDRATLLEISRREAPQYNSVYMADVICDLSHDIKELS